MLPTNLFMKEIMEDLKGKRSLAFKIVLPIILVSPLAIFPVPSGVKSSIISILILFLGVFGSAVGLAKLREGGMLERLVIAPTSKKSMMAQYVLANSVMDLLQLSVPVAILALQPLIPAQLPILIVTFVAAVLASNALGAVVAVAAGSSGEVHLFATLAVILVAAASGLFMPLNGPLSSIVAASPFNNLAMAFLALWQDPTKILWPIGVALSLLLFSVSMLTSDRFFKIS